MLGAKNANKKFSNMPYSKGSYDSFQWAWLVTAVHIPFRWHGVEILQRITELMNKFEEELVFEV